MTGRRWAPKLYLLVAVMVVIVQSTESAAKSTTFPDVLDAHTSAAASVPWTALSVPMGSADSAVVFPSPRRHAVGGGVKEVVGVLPSFRA